jgi:hypothetical protein
LITANGRAAEKELSMKRYFKTLVLAFAHEFLVSANHGALDFFDLYMIDFDDGLLEEDVF